MVMVSVGLVLCRLEVLHKENKTVLANMNKHLFLPAVLFTRILELDSNEIGNFGWALVLMPFLVVALGLMVGWLLVRVTNLEPRFHTATIVAIAFSSATSLPIALLEVMTDYLRSADIDAAELATFLPLYLISYPSLLWIVAGSMLSTPEDPEHDTAQIQMPRTSADEGLGNHGKRKSLTFEDLPNSIIRTLSTDMFQDVPDDHDNASSWLRESIMEIREPASFREKATKILIVVIHLFAQPPVAASILGLLIALTPFRLVWTETSGGMHWLFGALETTGSAIVPITLILLGESIYFGISSIKRSTWRMCFDVIFGKLVLMPVKSNRLIFPYFCKPIAPSFS